MKLRNFALTAIVLSSAYLVGCTATASVSPNPSASVTPSATPTAVVSVGAAL